MQRTRSKYKSKWRQAAIFLTAGTMSIFLIGNALLAEPSDSTKSKLEEGIFVQVDTTHRPPNPVSLKALERLQANSMKKWNVQWDEKTGLPGIGSGKIEGKYKGNAEETAITFMSDYKGLFLGIADSQLLACYTFEATRAQKDRQIGASVKAQSKFKGVNIWKSHATVIFSLDGSIEAVYNFLKPIMLDDVTPTLSTAQATQIVQDAFSPDSVKFGDDELELCILPWTPPRLAYIGFCEIGIKTRRIILDAHTGEFISAQVWGIEDNWDIPRRDHDVLDSSGDSAAVPIPPPMYKSTPVYPLPDSLSPERKKNRDSSGHSEALELPYIRKVEPPGPAGPKITLSSMTSCESVSCCSFYRPNIEFDLQTDADGDGFYRTAYLQWDADTDQDSSFVKVICFGEDNQGEEHLIFEFGPYWIWGYEW